MLTRFTVFFEDPFWVGISEREGPEGISASRVVFGAEPTDLEVFCFILERYSGLFYSRVSVETGHVPDFEKISPKRRQRMAARELSDARGLKKAYDAINLERELRKEELRKDRRERKEAEKELRFQERQAKKKEKHRGH